MSDYYRSYLAYQIRRLAEDDLPIPLDLFMAAATAGIDPEEIYDVWQDELLMEPDPHDQDAMHRIIETEEDLAETNETLWKKGE
jgi:hypothetical protein